MEHWILYLSKKYDIFELLNNPNNDNGNGELIFADKNGDKKIRYTFSSYHSIYNKKYPDNTIEPLKVFHFNKIANYYHASDGDDYKNNVNKGFMKVTLSFIILQLLLDNRLNGVDFEINLVDTARIIINGQLQSITDMYNDFFNDSDIVDKREKFRLFTASNRDSDIEYFKKLYLDTVQRKNGEISYTESINL
ncbi:TPA: hypothetical protein U1346_002201 [Streptococcus suis]|nr:hypothetical protein [Streptococcus suis]HEM5207876.1 hypothetical protein [Streptococcus suis]HEM5228386.1 hypothetical protein [Streptococcus suis]HEM5230445.1 hypothetical protein [Streptococcus suis]HEM5249540.1 hypothetical protein [Streptococcus suis]